MLHLHGFQHRQCLPPFYRVAGGGVHFDYRAVHGRFQLAGAGALFAAAGPVGALLEAGAQTAVLQPHPAVLVEPVVAAAHAVQGGDQGAVVVDRVQGQVRATVDAFRGQVEGAFAVALGQHQRLRAHAAGVPVAVAGAAGGVTGADAGEQQGGQRPQGVRGVGGAQARVVGEGPVDKGGGGVAGGERRMAQDRRQEAAVVVQAHQHGVFHGADQPAARFVAAGAEGDDLGQHGVVVAAHFGAVHQAVVNAHALAIGRPPAQHRAGLRQVALGRVLGVEAHFHGVAGEPYLLLGERQGLAGGHPQLPGHQVLAGDQLGDRVLHLQAGVHFQKVELAVRAEQELHGAGAHVIAGLGGVHRRLAHAPAQVLVDHRGGRFLHHLLMAALH